LEAINVRAAPYLTGLMRRVAELRIDTDQRATDIAAV